MAEKNNRILIIDDDVKLCEILARLLGKSCYEIHIAHDGRSVFANHDFKFLDLVLLDVMLPGENGFSILRKIRAISDIPVIMLTARGDTNDRLNGFEAGADDYLPKPFEPDELEARIRAILRRTSGRLYRISADNSGDNNLIPFGIFSLDKGKRAMVVSGKIIPLTLMEFRFAEYMAHNAGVVVSRDQITNALYGDDFDPDKRGLDILVSRLRRKLGLDEIQVLKTIHGQGYLLVK